MEDSECNKIKFEIYQELGECYTHTGDIEKAIVHFQEARVINPESEKPLVGLGVAVLQHNNIKEAKTYFKKALAINPNNDNALTGLALAYSNNGSAKKGFTKYQEAFQINPGNKTALLGIVQYAYSVRQLDVAVEYLKKYIELFPGNTKMLYCLAGTYFKQNKLSDAKGVLENIFIFDPANSDAHELNLKIKATEESSGYGMCQNS